MESVADFIQPMADQESTERTMKKDLWQRAEEIFHAALEQTPQTRRKFLKEACGGDIDLRRRTAYVLGFI